MPCYTITGEPWLNLGRKTKRDFLPYRGLETQEMAQEQILKIYKEVIRMVVMSPVKLLPQIESESPIWIKKKKNRLRQRKRNQSQSHQLKTKVDLPHKQKKRLKSNKILRSKANSEFMID